MQIFNNFTGLVAPMPRANIDTDQIIPKQYLKSIRRTGFGANLFDKWRYLDEGQPDQDHSLRPKNPEFILNQPAYSEVDILLTQANFGCGSSREHAPWALVEFGFKCIIAPSFADIFYNNSFKNGLLLITLPMSAIEALFERAASSSAPLRLAVNLTEQYVLTLSDAASLQQKYAFEIDAFRKQCLLEGLDDIGLTLQAQSDIRAYEAQQKKCTPWLFEDLSYDH